MSQQTPGVIRVFCGELCKTNECNSSTINLLHRDINGILANITIGFEKFVRDPEMLPPRILDLLQIAAYIFCADRMANRGARNSINNDSWARTFEINVPVMDYDYWNNAKVLSALEEALQFMTGDRKYHFNLHQATQNTLGPVTKQTSMFSGEFEALDDVEQTDIVLFSGGLDSLAGTIQRLNEEGNRKICAVSHRANKTVMHTQHAIIGDLNKRYDNRIRQYGFQCHNHQMKSIEETQRTRMFLFSAIAFSIASCYGKHEFFVYENGITSINMPKQGDVMNARASRTTHPKTLGLLRRFYRYFDDSFDIIAPYYNKTKAQVMEAFRLNDEMSIITSSVSCSSTRSQKGQEAHCGCCSQCIDRRFAVYAAGLWDYDAQYTDDFISRDIRDDETRQRLYYTMRLASAERIGSKDELLKNYSTDVFDIVNFWPGNNPDDKLSEVYDLLSKYGDSVLRAAKAMQVKHEDLNLPVNPRSFLGIVAERNYLQSPIANRVKEIDVLLRENIPLLFQRERPKSENDFNDKMQALLSGHGKFSREYPVFRFWKAAYVPDHAQDRFLIESKYIRGTTKPSVITEGIAADMTKMPSDCGVLFVVYDPEGKITSKQQFISEYEAKRPECFVRVYP